MKDLTGGALQLLPKIYDDLAQPSVQKIGITLGTVFEFSTIPFLYLQNFNNKVKINLKRNLDNYKSKLDAIPEENLCEVNPQIGIPLLERLTYTTNEEIANLFTSLLAKGSNTETVNEAHPSFIRIIERLSIDEARIINYIRKDNYIIPYIDVVSDCDERSLVYLKYLTGIETKIDLQYPDDYAFYFENLTSAGIFTELINYNEDPQEVLYRDLSKHYQLETYLSLSRAENIRLRMERMLLQTTAFGRKFIKACTEELKEEMIKV